MRLCSLIALLMLVCAQVRADTVVLANGDKLEGEILEWSVDRLLLDHPQLGMVELSLDQLAIDTGTPPTPGLLDTNFLRGWRRTIDAGFNGKSGNSRTTNITLGLNFGYEDEFKRWQLNGRYFLNDTDDGDGDNNGRFDIRRDWLFPGSRWFVAANFRYQYDQFESWNQRTVAGVGPGYQLVRRRAHQLDTRLQPVHTYEAGDRDANKAETMWALDYRWQSGERHSFHLSNQIFSQLLPESNEYRNVTIGEWRVALTQRPSLSLRLGAENEWETDIEPGDKRNDLKYYMTLGLDF